MSDKTPNDKANDKSAADKTPNDKANDKANDKGTPATGEPLTLSRCSSNPDCENEALRNFPSEMECEHEVCLSCLEKMIIECESCDYLPMCPNEQCRLPYRVESVSALRALLPDHAKYFAGLSLELHNYEVIRDDTISSADIPIDYNAKENHFETRCGISDDEEGPKTIVFTKSGTLGEFIREVRQLLGIFPSDKVYGFFIRREDGEDERLPLTPETVHKPIGDFLFETENVLIVDMSGIVVAKNAGPKNQ